MESWVWHWNGFVHTSRIVNATLQSVPAFRIRENVSREFLRGAYLNLYVAPIAQIFNECGIKFHQYADDTQLHTEVNSADISNFDDLKNCVRMATNWFLANDLQLNADKTKAILFGTRQILVKHQDNTVLRLGNCDVKYGSTVKILGVQLDSTLSLIPKVDSIVRSCNYHIRALRHIRNCLTRNHEDDRFRSSDFSIRLLQLFTVQHIEIQHQQVGAYPGPEQSSKSRHTICMEERCTTTTQSAALASDRRQD